MDFLNAQKVTAAVHISWIQILHAGERSVRLSKFIDPTWVLLGRETSKTSNEREGGRFKVAKYFFLSIIKRCLVN
jgi:hypothetical protein